MRACAVYSNLSRAAGLVWRAVPTRKLLSGCGFWVRKMGPYLVQFLGLVFLGFLRKYNRTWKKPVPKLGPFLVAKIAPRSGPRNQKIADLRLVFVGRPGRRLQPRGREPSPETEGGLDSEIVFWCFLGLSFWTSVLGAEMVRFWIQLRQGCGKRA